jgi:hypothetical protein
MEHSADQPKRIRFRISRAPGYRIHPASGAWGGVGPKRDYVIHFYVEHSAVPDAVTHDVAPGGKLGPEVLREPDTEVLEVDRELMTGVVMSLDEAEVLAKWILKNVTEYRKATEGTQG